jgi:putative protein-disulfide isomerase
MDRTTTLHYIFDPLCGWCYAAAPLVKAARELSGLAIALHGGGMMAGNNRRPITPQWRDYVMPHDRRIAQMTGQAFGQAYFEGLLRDSGAVMDSEPPTTAILAAEALDGRGLDMLHRLQRAHYVDGRRIAEREVLEALAAGLGLNAGAFRDAFAGLAGDATRQHFADSRQWLARCGGHGFPTFALESGGQLEALDIGPWLGRPDDWQNHLRGYIGHVPSDRPAQAAVGPVCGPDACSL